jgi:hypothetical protein
MALRVLAIVLAVAVVAVAIEFKLAAVSCASFAALEPMLVLGDFSPLGLVGLIIRGTSNQLP